MLSLLIFRTIFFSFILLVILLADLKFYLIPDLFVLPGLILALAINLILGAGFINLLIGILIGGVFFLLQYLFTRGKGVGFGDIKLGVLLGAMFGWKMTVLVIVIAYLIGAIIAGFLLITRKKKFGDVLPMGSFLSAAGIIVIFLGDKILELVL